MHSAPLPPELRGRAIRSADHRDFGLTAGRLRRSDVQHPFHGVSAHDLDISAISSRCRAFEPLLLPGQFFSHVSAAMLYDAPLPYGLDDGRLDIAVFDPRTPPRGLGVHGHRVTGVRVQFLGDLPIASPADVWCQLGPLLHREDLVAVGDHLVTGRRIHGVRVPARTSVGRLRDAAIHHAGKRGAASIAWALERVRSGVDSRRETQLRLLLVAGGLPEVDLDVEVAVGRGIVLHPDLSYRRWRVAFEYEGDIHRTDPKLWRRDIERRELLEAAGWRVVRVTADDLYAGGVLLDRVRRIIAQR